jgi:predicted nucleic acid-binding Zn ribbon protein
MRRTETLHIGDVLNEFFSRPYVAAKVAEGRLPDTWREVVGERVASLTSSLRLENHVLYAHITSSVVRTELFNRREALAAEINRVSGVRLVNVVIIK